MDDATRDRIREGLVKAIQAEIEGQHFYKMAASNTQDEQGRQVLERLAAEELDHATYLRAQYDAITERGEVDERIKLGPRMELGEPSPIFSDRLRDRAEGAHFEMTALSIGMQLEEGAERFYKAEAVAAAGVPKVQEFFLRLAEWESGHFHALHRQYEALKEEYWGEQGFSPF